MSTLIPIRTNEDEGGNVVDVYIVGGQSQLDGRNSGASGYFDGDNKVPGCKMYKHQSGVFDDFQFGVNAGDFTGVSTAWSADHVAFNLLAEELNKTIYIVKGTRGNSSMGDNIGGVVGSFHIPWEDELQTKDLMTPILWERIEAARRIFAIQGKIVRFKAMFWAQGEGDRNAPQNAAHQALTEAFFTFVRKITWNPTLPIVMCNVPTASVEYDSTVAAGIANIVSADSNVYLTDVSSGSVLGDNVHWGNATSIQAGIDAFNILKTL